MFYAVYRENEKTVKGFILDEKEEEPLTWDSEEEAREDLKDYQLYSRCLIDVIEIGDQF